MQLFKYIFRLLWWRLLDCAAAASVHRVYLLLKFSELYYLTQHEEVPFFSWPCLKNVLSGQIRTRWIRYGVILLPHFFPSFFRFLLLSFFLSFIFLNILSFLVCLSAHQHDNWLLILVISRVRLTPIVSIRLPWAINVTSDLSKGAQSPLSPVTAHQNGVKPSTAEPPPSTYTYTHTPLTHYPPHPVWNHTRGTVFCWIPRICQNR